MSQLELVRADAQRGVARSRCAVRSTWRRHRSCGRCSTRSIDGGVTTHRARLPRPRVPRLVGDRRAGRGAEAPGRRWRARASSHRRRTCVRCSTSPAWPVTSPFAEAPSRSPGTRCSPTPPSARGRGRRPTWSRARRRSRARARRTRRVELLRSGSSGEPSCTRSSTRPGTTSTTRSMSVLAWSTALLTSSVTSRPATSSVSSGHTSARCVRVTRRARVAEAGSGGRRRVSTRIGNAIDTRSASWRQRQSAERTPRRPNQASSPTQCASCSGSCDSSGSVSACRLMPSAMPDDRVREHEPVLGRARDLDERAHRLGGVREHAVDHVGELGVVAGGRTEQQPERGPIALHEAEVGGEALGDAVAPRLHGAGRLPEHLEQSPADVLEHRDEQRPLRREVLVEDRLRDAGGAPRGRPSTSRRSRARRTRCRRRRGVGGGVRRAPGAARS